MKTANLFEETHKYIIEILFEAVKFDSAHFKKWDASIDFELAVDDEGNPLLPRDILISVLLMATSDTEHNWTLVLASGEDSSLSVSYHRDVDDEDIGEFVFSILGRNVKGRRSYRFGYDLKGNLLYGGDALNFGWVISLTQDEVWGEFFSLIAKI